MRERVFDAQNMLTGLMPISFMVRASIWLLASRLLFRLLRKSRCVDFRRVAVKPLWCCLVMVVFLQDETLLVVLLTATLHSPGALNVRFIT